MNSFATIIFKVMLTGLKGLFNSFWQLGSEGESSLVAFLRASWPIIVIALCVGGFVVDRLVYLFRWRPYYVWSTSLRRWKQRREGAPVEEAPAPTYRQPFEPVDEPPAVWDEPARPLDCYPPQETRRSAPMSRYQQTRVNAVSVPHRDMDSPYAPPASMATRAASPYARPQPDWPQRTSYVPPQPDYASPKTAAPMPQETRVSAPPAYRVPAPHAEKDMAELMDGITPSFGARQPTPPSYQTEPRLVRAPQAPAAQPLPPETPVHPGLNPELFRRNLGLNEQGMPEEGRDMVFPDTTFVPYYQSTQYTEQGKPKKGLRKLVSGASILASDDARESLSIRDLQKTTDFRTAFHAPVYPKKPQSEEVRPQ